MARHLTFYIYTEITIECGFLKLKSRYRHKTERVMRVRSYIKFLYKIKIKKKKKLSIQICVSFNYNFVNKFRIYLYTCSVYLYNNFTIEKKNLSLLNNNCTITVCVALDKLVGNFNVVVRPCYVSDQIVHVLLRSTEARTELNGCQLTAVTATLRTKKPPHLGVRNTSILYTTQYTKRTNVNVNQAN